MKASSVPSSLALFALLFVVLCGPAGPASAADDVCSAGTGIPPFLASGADPNLLLVLDNSGSMLDMAYVDDEKYKPGTTEEYKNSCYDKGYLKEQKDGVWGITPGKEYAGYFEKNTWYKWEEPADGSTTWKTKKVYKNEDIVWSNGRLYAAKCIPTAPATTCESGTSAGASLELDTGLTWAVIDPADIAQWDSAKDYAIGALVAYQGMVFKANAKVDAGKETLFENRNGLELAWDRLDEGFFSPQATPPCDSPSYTYTEDGRLELQVTFGLDAAGERETVTCFAARGNLLNWATASKLDIQKKILTGGKFYSGNERWTSAGVADNTWTDDAADDRLVSEHRGCSGKGFAKEIPLNGPAVNTNKSLVLKVRGPVDRIDKLDAADFTTRIEIVEMSDSIEGINYEACAAYLNLLETDKPSLPDLQSALEKCMYGSKPVQPVFNIYHSSLHDCWKISKGDNPPHSGNLPTQCEAVYPEKDPWLITPWDPQYICYGQWDATSPPTPANNYAGKGYVGRCWEDWPRDSEGVCRQKTCNGLTESGWVAKKSGNQTVYYKNESDVGQLCQGGVQYSCESDGSIDTDSQNPKCSGQNENFAIVYVRSNNVTPCVPVADENATWGFDSQTEIKACVEQAERDYCTSLNVPEVIDPSDLPTNSEGTVWGISAAIVDALIYGQMGVEKPLKVMKGYIKYNLPEEQQKDDLARPDGPRGILYDTADNLRIGAMAFRDNGSKTECQKYEEACTINSNSTYCTARQSIEKYCSTENADGAEVIAQIKKGMYVDDKGTPENSDDDQEHWEHYVNLAAAINDIRATSWTPLAEAMYTALGYYGQRSDRRLNVGDFYTKAEGVLSDTADATTSSSDGENLWPDPVQYWCQDNHILVISEGSSTADINDAMVKFASEDVANKAAAAEPQHDVTGSVCTDGLEGSSYFSDLVWFGQHATVTGAEQTSSDLFAQLIKTGKDDPVYEKQSITTHVVATGALEDGDPDNPCDPETLMNEAATNGGTTLYKGENPDQLEANLKAALSDILSRASAGSAASVISSSRSGEGGVYQAIFWPRMERGIDQDPLVWAGDVHAFFIDDKGLLWDDHDKNGKLWSEDKDGDGILDVGEDRETEGVVGKLDGDRRVITYYDKAANMTRICHNASVVKSGTCAASEYADTGYVSIDLREFEAYLWSANQQLQAIDEVQIATNRSITDGRWNFSTNRRYIFTWNDLDNDGIVDADEVLPLEANDTTGIHSGLGVAASRGDVLSDFRVSDDAELDALFNWLRGEDGEFEVATDGTFTPFDALEDQNLNGVQDSVYRCRRYPSCAKVIDNQVQQSEDKVWRLGDVIHSTPTLASRPAEGYHLVYSDPDYARFYKKYVDRRHVLYFGGNDGMLHAVNAGFYDVGGKGFLPCRKDQRGTDGNCSGQPYQNGYPALGDELWAYVPHNLQPHLKCLTDPKYSHKYYVDAPPRIFDVRIFADDGDAGVHPGGWGTILVGYMRFGGATTPADESGTLGDKRQFVSAYFILDITDPERPPTLLAEMTMPGMTVDHDDDPATAEVEYTNLGYTTAMPSVVAMRDDAGNSEWYLVLGNGPTTLKGQNNQQGKVAVVPLSSFTGVNWKDGGIANPLAKRPFRIPAATPQKSADSDTPNVGIFPIPAASATNSSSFVGDMVTVDYDIGGVSTSGIGKAYKSDAVYFGTVDGKDFAATVSEPDTTRWTGGGRMFRLVTKVLDADVEKYSYPWEWSLQMFLDARAPITAAPNIGYDGDNFWLYFGTGRFFAPEDKTDDTQQYFFGVKEPRDGDCKFTWDPINWYSGTTPASLNPAAEAGERGLFRADQVRVVKKGSLLGLTEVTAYMYCETPGCLEGTLLPPVGSDASGTAFYDFGILETYIRGEKCGSTADETIGIDGWYRHLVDPRERSLGMPVLLGGLTTFTTYQPSEDLCTAEGNSFLYGVYYLTGTAWYENVFGTYLEGDKTIVKDRLGLGLGLATSPSMVVGTEGQDAKAFVQTSTGEIVEVGQENLPVSSSQSGRTSWSER